MTNTITLLDIIEDTVVDGPGFRVSVYAAGCTCLLYTSDAADEL